VPPPVQTAEAMPPLPAGRTPEAPEEAAKRVARSAARHAADLDRDGAFPAADILALGERGLLAAPLPPALGGSGCGTEAAGADGLCAVLRTIGRASLPLGRLYEGHVNSLRLVARYGTTAQRERLAEDVGRSLLFGVWNTESPPGLRLHPEGPGVWLLEGGKTFASGAGHVRRPLVTARRPDTALPQMVLVPLGEAELAPRADLSPWAGVHGMKASATGCFDFSGLRVSDDDLVGRPGDYEKEPDFSVGAWRFAAVQTGGIEAVVGLLRAHLRDSGRGGDPHQRRRLGEAAMAAETARLWLRRAASIAEDPASDPEEAMAYVGLARLAVEQAALQALEQVERGIGVRAFLGGQTIERVARDLRTYLRQPAPDRVLDAAAGFVLDHGGFGETEP
jgi:alkylation response protein AidB-like acyl-CoA dehydrogenase